MILFSENKKFNFTDNEKTKDRIFCLLPNEEYKLQKNETVFGIGAGVFEIQLEHSSLDFKKTCAFSLNEGKIKLLSGHMTLFAKTDYFGVNMFFPQIEKFGRLKYIDGCHDSVLISPPKMGEPCLNALYFPENTKQTFHHHPSLRFGFVLHGEGSAETSTETFSLKPGQSFYIPANEKHRFKTENQKLVIVAYHPDSDWGPTDEKHPMINKTILNI